MNRKESFKRRMSRHSKRKESVSSDITSESESYFDSFVPIKKEVPHTIIVEKKFLDKLIQQIQKQNSFNEMLKKKYNEDKEKNKYTKSLANEFSIISTQANNNNDKDKENLEKEKEKKNIDTENNKTSNINTNANSNTNNITNNNTNINININNNNANIININKPKVNPNSSMMSLFMNSQRGKMKEKEENDKLKLVITEMAKKHEMDNDNYKTIIKELSFKVESLQKEIKNLNEVIEKMKQKANINKQKIEIALSHPKVLSKVMSYLENEDKFSLSKCNNFLYQNIYFRAVSEKINNKLKTKEKILEKLEDKDVAKKFDIKENEISELIKTYIIDQKVSGIEMRNEIVKSLVFLENYVKIPLANFKGPIGERENMFNMEDQPKKGKFFTKFFSALKSEIKEDIGMNQKSENVVNNNFISFNPEEFNDIFETDKHVLKTFKTDKSLNVQYEYTENNKIKDIINEFFVCQLPQASYQKFITKICETFSDLLHSSFLALNDIKNLQIIVYALYCRYMKNKVKIEDLQSVVEDLNHFADSSRQIKEMLTKTKNELEFKYTNSMMTISQLNSIITQKDNEINDINLKSKEKDEKYNKFKNEIINEYKKIKDDFDFTKKQRDSLKGILVELKDYFVKVVSGEFLN